MKQKSPAPCNGFAPAPLANMGINAGLTYCLNVHPTQSLLEIEEALQGPVRRVKDAVSPDASFFIGARFSAQSVGELKTSAARERLKSILSDNDYLAATVNGFPFGAFHGAPVKEDVYLPDWRGVERLGYTCDLADLMADLQPDASMITLSTSPGAFRVNGAGAEEVIADNYLHAAAHCAALEARTGVRVAIAIEAEPACLFETTAETAAFFEKFLLTDQALSRFSALSGLDKAQAGDAVRRYLGVCFDVCHAAVEFEAPRDSLAGLERLGVEVFKVQLSSALRIPSVDDAMRQALQDYDEPVYLHQVVARQADGALKRFDDLGQALAQGRASDGEEWRIHYHVPIFEAAAGDFATTQDVLAEVLALHKQKPVAPHLEVETYTFDVLPPHLRAPSVEDNIIRELRWAEEKLA